MTDIQYVTRNKKKHKERYHGQTVHRDQHCVQRYESSENKHTDKQRTVTPEDPKKLTSADRKRLLQKRFDEFEDNEKTINEIQNEMAEELKRQRSGRSNYSNYTRSQYSVDTKVSNHGSYVKHQAENHRRSPIKNDANLSIKSPQTPKFYTELPPQKPNNMSSVQTSHPVRNNHMTQSNERNYEQNRVPQYKTKNGEPDYSEYRYISGVGTKDVQNIRKAGRHRRASILYKAEQLLNHRKRRDFSSSDDDTPNIKKPPKVVYLAKRSRSNSDIEYISVPEVIEDDDSSSHSAQLLASPRNRITRSGIPSVAQSEIPVLYSDEDDTGLEPRPFTDTMRNRNPYYPSYRRYEGENDHVRINFRDPAHKKIGRSSGALVRFFRNGDSNDKGLPLTVNRKFLNFEALLVFLNDKIPTPTGVKYVFKWPEGTEVKSITDFRNRCVYVVASRNKLNRDVTYGESAESFWSNRKPSAGLRKHEVDLFKRPRSPKDSPTRNSPLVVTIINNTSRDKREKVILNPNTQQTFEEWLEDITNPDIPIKGIFSDKPPYQEVKSFSQLFRELKINSNFLACGDEMIPVEVAQKRQAPSSNSSTDSVNESRGKKKKVAKQNEMGQIYENGRPESPTSTSMSRYDTGPKYPPYGTRGRLESRRNTKDRVEIEIDGAIREFYPPTYIDPEDDGMKPNKTLRCEWVYGFKGRDAHDNMLVLPSGELVYYVAAVVVLFDKDKDIQRHYIKHNEEVTCMSLHPYRNLIATGQLHGKEPEHASHIRIWDTGSLSTYSVIGLGVFFGGIISIGFCKDGIGNFMCVLDGSEKHVLSVWEWQTERVVARTTTSSDAVHCACFYPDGANNSLLITYGARHIFFWKIFYDIARKKEAKILRDRQSGIFEEGNFADHLIDEVPKSVNCLAFLPTGDVISGDSSGNLMVWDRDSSDAFTCKFVVHAHNGTIMAMCLLDDGTLLTTSGSEIKAWDTESNFRPVKTRTIPQEAGKIRSLITQTPGGVDGKIYVGTNNGAILDGSLQLKFRYLVQGHSDGIRGVFPHPFEPTFVSAGLDQVVYKWSLVNHKVIWRAQVEAPCTALAIDYRQELIAIGTSDGIFIVLNSYNGMHIATVEVGTESVCCLAFSPDGSLLALGCNDGLISVYAIHDRGQTYRKFNMALKGHNSGVSNIDWSKDGRCLQSVSVDHELLFWDIDSMQMIKIPRMMRDVDWFTHTCHVAYYLLGPWTNMEKNETVKVVNRSNYRDLLVTGDSRGRVRLYKYPCSKERAEFRSAQIYSSDVTAVCFTPHNSHVLSCGGKDSALVQWQISEDQ